MAVADTAGAAAIAKSPRNRPRFTEFFQADDFVIEAGSEYISGLSDEERSKHVADLARRCASARYIELDEGTDGIVRVSDGTEVRLRSFSDLLEFWSRRSSPSYLDITGLTHRVWPSLLRAALIADHDVRVVYVEPLRYRFNTIRTEGELFDLSVRFEGIGPLPGFLSLAEPAEESVLLVPLLGFEGQRLSMVLNQVQVPRDRIVPVIGVPGFQPEFVFYAYQGNRLPLEETLAWQSVQFAAANCPFSLFYTLATIAAENPDAFLKIAPVGTKPHGLGAVLFALSEPERVELVYDHPIRREGRTAGAARLLVYHVRGLRPLLQL